MTDRTVSVGLDANISGFLSKMAAAGLSTKGLGSALSDVNTKVLNSETSLKKLGPAFDGVVSGQMAIAAGGLIAAGALVKFGKDSVAAYVELADRVRQFSRVSGESAEESSKMIARADALGISSDSLSTAMFRLGTNVKTNAAELHQHGIELAHDKTGQIDLAGTLDNVIAAYVRSTSAQEKDEIAKLALSRGAKELIPLLSATAAQLHEIDKAAADHHQILTQHDLDQARAYTLSVHELGLAIKGIEIEAGKVSVPFLTEFAHETNIAITYADKLVSALSPPPKQAGGGFWQDRIADIHGLALSAAESLPVVGGFIVTSELGVVDATNKMEAAVARADLTLIGLASQSGVAQERISQLAREMGIDLVTATAADIQKLNEMAQKLNAAVTPTQKLESVTAALGNRFATTAEQANAYDTAIAATVGTSTGVDSATVKLRQSVQTLADSFHEGQKAGESYGEYQDRLKDQAAGIVTQVDNVRKALVVAGQLDPSQGVQFMVASLQQLEGEFPQLRGQLDGYLRDLERIPGSKNTKFTVDTDEAQAKLDALQRKLLDTGDYAGDVTKAIQHQQERDAAAFIAGLVGAQAQNTLGPNAVGHDTAAEDHKEASYLEALWRARMEGVENRFHAGKASLAEYEASLDEQMSHEVPWTNAWVALQQKKADAVHYWSDAVKTYLDALAAHQSELQDNEYAVGVLGKDQYLALLQERLKGLEEYSNEWKRVWDEIKHIEGDALDAQIKLIQAYDQGRQFQHAFDSLADQRALSASRGLMSAVPQTSSTSIVKTVTYSPTLNAYGSDATRATTTANQQMRDYAALVGV